MTMDVDRFPTLGPRRRIVDDEGALALVKALHPDAVQHGSTGAERTWTIGKAPQRMIVAHHWSPSTGRAGRPWWIRIASSAAHHIPFDLAEN